MEQVISDYIRDIYQKARADSLLMLCAALAFAAGAALLVWAFQRHRPAYLFHKTTKKTFHYAFMAMVALLCILRFSGGGSALRLTLSLLAVLFAAVGIYGLITWRSLGVGLSLVSVWLSLPMGELATVLGAASDVRNITAFAPTSRVAIYGVACFALSRMAVLALAAAGITVAMIAYYAKRRYLFKTAQVRYFTGISLCPACQAPVISGDAHCPACGGNLSQRPGSVLRWEPLDEPKHCKTCGKELDDKGRCSLCEKSGIGDMVRKDAADTLKEELKKKLVYLLIPLLVILPVFLGKGLNGLTEGGTLVSNAYVTRFNEWYNDPSVARSADWLDSFDQASDALRRYDARAFAIRPDKLGYTDFYGYIQYTEACCWQIEAIDCAREAVHASDPSQKDVIAGVFNETLDMQQRALTSRMDVIGAGNLFQKVINMVIDACRFYLSFLPAFVFPILLLLVGIAALALGIVLLRKGPATSPFVTAAPSPDVSPKDVIASDIRRKAYLRRERTVTLAGLGLALLLFAVCFGVASAKNKTESPAPQNPMYTAFAEDGGRIIAWLSTCDTDPDEARAQLGPMEGVIDDCLRNLAYIAEDPEADEEAAAITALLTPELKALKQQAADGQLPDRDTQKRIIALVAEGARLSARSMLQDAFDTLNDS